MIGGISKKLLATIVSWVAGVLSLLGFIFLAFPSMYISRPNLNNYQILTEGFNFINDRVAWNIRALSFFNLFIIIFLVLSIGVSVLSNIKFVKLRYAQTGCYFLISLLSFLDLIFNEQDLRFPLTMGIFFFVLFLITGYFSFQLFKGNLKDESLFEDNKK